LETQLLVHHPFKWVLVVGHKWMLVIITQPPFVVMVVFLHGGIMVRVDWVMETQPTVPPLFKWVLVVGHRSLLGVFTQ
jgi:hypothetical protein